MRFLFDGEYPVEFIHDGFDSVIEEEAVVCLADFLIGDGFVAEVFSCDGPARGPFLVVEFTFLKHFHSGFVLVLIRDHVYVHGHMVKRKRIFVNGA